MSATDLDGRPAGHGAARSVAQPGLGHLAASPHARCVAVACAARPRRNLPAHHGPPDEGGMADGPSVHPAPVRAAAASHGRNFHDTHANTGILSALFLFAPRCCSAPSSGHHSSARELETGTFRYTWTQGAGRTRWAIAMVFTGVAGVRGPRRSVRGARRLARPTALAQPRSRHGCKPASSPPPGSRSSAGAWRRSPSASWPGCSARRVLPALATAVPACVRARFRRLQAAAPLPDTPQDQQPRLHPRVPDDLPMVGEGGRRVSTRSSTRSCEPVTSNRSRTTAEARSPPPPDPGEAQTPSPTCSSTATPNGPATSPPAATGPSNGSNSAGSPPSPCSSSRPHSCSCDTETHDASPETPAEAAAAVRPRHGGLE